MNDQDMQEAIAKLREDLRNERSNDGTNERDRSFVESSRSANASFRSDSEDIGGYTETASGNTEDARSGNRSAKSRSKRSRPDSGRPEYDSGFSPDRGSEVRRTGLARGDMPIETPKSHVGPRLKEQAQGFIGNVKSALMGKKGSVLTKKEVEEYREPLKEAIIASGDDLDKLLEWRIKSRLGQERTLLSPIWSNITDFEAEAQTKLMLKRGMENAYAAETVRKFVAMRDWITVGVMHVPRIQMSVELLRVVEREARKKNETNN